MNDNLWKRRNQNYVEDPSVDIYPFKGLYKLVGIMELDSDIEKKQTQLQAIVNNHFYNLKCSNTLIISSTDINLQMVSVILKDNPIDVALARGLSINKDGLSLMGILNQFNILDKIAIGDICIDPDWINELSDDEIKFLLGHEVAHIYCDHPLSKETLKYSIELFEKILKNWDKLLNVNACDLIKEGKDAVVILKSREIIKNVPQNLKKCKDKLWGRLPNKADRTMQKEIEADSLAIYLTKDKCSAISCLEKLLSYNKRMGFNEQKNTYIEQRLVILW